MYYEYVCTSSTLYYRVYTLHTTMTATPYHFSARAVAGGLEPEATASVFAFLRSCFSCHWIHTM